MEYQLYSLAKGHMSFVSSHSSIAEAVKAAKLAELQINDFVLFNVSGGWPVFATQEQIIKEYRAALIESLDELFASEFPRK